MLLLACFRQRHAANFIDPLLKRVWVHSPQVQIHECLDASFEFTISASKAAPLFSLGSLKSGRVSQTPMRGDWLARPYRAGLRRRLVAHRKHESKRGPPAKSFQLFERRALVS